MTQELPTAIEVEGEEEKKKNIYIPVEDIEAIYQLYPTSDKNYNGRTTGKSIKNKDKIKSILKSKTETKESLINKINNYVSGCYKTNTFLMNFKTFLNNLPEDIKKEPIEYFQDEYGNWCHMEKGKRIIHGKTKPDIGI
jgi:hypothetical protein